MYDLLDILNKILEPLTTRTIMDHFNLPEEKARIVLPMVAAFFLIRMKKYLKTQSPNDELVARLERVLAADSAHPTTWETLEARELEALSQEVLGERNDMLAQALASLTGVDTHTGAALRDDVLTLVMMDLSTCLETWAAMNPTLSQFKLRPHGRLELLRLLLNTKSRYMNLMGPPGVC